MTNTLVHVGPAVVRKMRSFWCPKTGCKPCSGRDISTIWLHYGNMQLPSDNFYRINKLPPYVFAVINELKAKARAAGRDIVDMGMGNPDGATPQPVVDKLIEAARNPRNHRYSMSRGIPHLRDAIVDRYRKQYGVTLDPETEAIVTIGAKD